MPNKIGLAVLLFQLRDQGKALLPAGVDSAVAVDPPLVPVAQPVEVDVLDEEPPGILVCAKMT